jgi:hypothetical protein
MARRVCVIAIALSAAASARAEMPARLSVAGQGDCPTAAAVARALERLHPALHAEVDGAGAVRVEVVDGGARYEVRAGEGTRRLEDPARRCGERATAAALAATLLLDPPAPQPVAEEPEPEGPLAPRTTPAEAVPPPATTTRPAAATTRPAPATTRLTAATTRPAPLPIAASPLLEPPAVRRAAPRAPARPSRIDLELGGILDGAPALGTSASQITGGAALRLAVGGRFVAGTLGFAGLAPATASSAGVDVTVVRIPFDAGVRLLLPVGKFEVGADVGLALAILQLSAPALDGASTNTRLDVGARIAPFARVELTARWSLVLGLQMIVSFAPYDLVVNGLPDKIATTPRLWLGGGLGVAVRL